MGEELLKNVWNRVQDWAAQNASKYLYVPVPAERGDMPADPQALTELKADAGYFRLWLCELFLAKRREWFTDWYPVVQSSVKLDFGGNAITLTRVVQAPADALTHGVRLNYALTDLVPYRGGDVEIEAALLALQGANHLGAAVKTLEGFSSLVVPTLGAALQIAAQVSSGMDELMHASGGEVHLGWHQIFSAQGGGGSNPLRPGYYAVILAGADQVRADQLVVKDDQLFCRTTDLAPFTGYDYLLFRIEGRATRPDWKLQNIEQPLNDAIKAYLKNDTIKADAYKLVALEAAINSSDLARHDQRRVSQAIADEMADYRSGARGPTGAAPPWLGQIVEARAMSIGDAAAMPDVTLGNVVGGPDAQAQSGGHDMASPNAFSAYPRVDAPQSATAHVPFDVTVGFKSDLDPQLADVKRLAVENIQPGDSLTVTLAGDGVDVLGVRDAAGALQKDTPYGTLTFDMDAQCVFQCQVQPGALRPTLRAWYFFHNQMVGMATRSIRVDGSLDPPAVQAGDSRPADTPVAHPSDGQPAGAPVPPPADGQPAGAPVANSNAKDAPAPAPNEPAANPCRMQLPHPPGSEVDLTVTITQQSDGSLQWQLIAATQPAPVQCTGKRFTEASAREFASTIITEMNASLSDALGASGVATMAQRITQVMPKEFFAMLGDVYKSIQPRTPTILFMLQGETYIPWELALLPKPLDKSLPGFLAAQAIVGRWIVDDDIMLPPPIVLDLHKMTVVAGQFGGASGLHELPHALDEQKALHDAFAAVDCEATRVALDAVVANPTAGHLIHFVVHGTSDPAMNEESLLLQNRGVLRATELMGSHNCGEDPRFAFVFLNACQVGTSGVTLGQAAGFPGDVINGGAAGFIAPLWSVNDDIAKTLAIQFYNDALSGDPQPIGQIMHKLHASYQPGQDNTPLSYLYYGHPNLRLCRRWT